MLRSHADPWLAPHGRRGQGHYQYRTASGQEPVSPAAALFQDWRTLPGALVRAQLPKRVPSLRAHAITCGVQIYDWAQEPKQLVLYDGAEHRLNECAAALEQLLTQWIPTTLRSAGSSEQERPS